MRAGWVCVAVLALAGAARGQGGLPQGTEARRTWPAPVGAEQVLLDLVEMHLQGHASRGELALERDVLGSLVVRRPAGSAPAPVRTLIALGIDQPCYVVSQVRDDGLLRVRTLGRGAGGSFHLAREGRPVDVLTRHGPVPGVLLVNNLHLRGPRPEVLGEEHLYLDVGADSPADVAALGIELLDPLQWDETVTLAGRFTAGPASATRAVLDVLLEVLAEAGEAGSLPADVAVAFVAQSQVGNGPLGRGGEALVRRLRPAETLVLRPGSGQAAAVSAPQPLAGAETVFQAVELRAAHVGTQVELFDTRDRPALVDWARARLGWTQPARSLRSEAEFGAEPAPADPPAFTLLRDLVLPRGVSGHEGPVRDAVRAQLAAIHPAWQPLQDEAGNLVLTLGDGPRHLAFVAHMDEIGVTVSALREDGLLETERHGGFYEHLYRETRLELVTRDGGVLPAIALPKPAGTPEGEDPVILLDVGARSATEATALGVAVGDPATVPKELRRLGAHRAAGRSPDDRVGCAALVLALCELGPDADAVLRAAGRRVTFAWVTREEVGLQGADHLARTLRPVPEVVFPVDTFVTSDTPRDDPRWAFAKLGGGPVLRALDNTSLTPRATLDRVRGVAAAAGIALQVGVMGGGNDGSRFVPEGAIDCPLAWPQRNSHSRVETLDLRDYEALGRLVAAVARGF